MFEIILATTLTCQEGNNLIDKIRYNKDIEPLIRKELLREIEYVMPKNCYQRK